MANLGSVGVYIRNFEVLGSVSYTPNALNFQGSVPYGQLLRTTNDSFPQSPNPFVTRRVQSVDSDNLFSSE